MAGHVIADYLKETKRYAVYTSSRQENGSNHYPLDVRNEDKVKEALLEVKPDVVINAVGILNQFAEADPKTASLVNGIFPHRLKDLANTLGARVIQISTDCVFSGERGNYAETDQPDGKSIYAKSKLLGELVEGRHLTIRTSIVGPELRENGIGLFQWFMKQKGQINGYQKVLWNGVTTLELARAIDNMIEEKISGLYHLTAPNVISKHDLLKKIQTAFQKDDVVIQLAETPVLNRTLLNTRSDFKYVVPDYDTMLSELKEWMIDRDA